MKNNKFFMSVTAVALSAAMAVTGFAFAAPVTANAADEAVSVPKPFWSVDFNNGWKDLESDPNFKVVDNAAKPTIAPDEYDGKDIQVLELGKTTGSEVTGKDYAGNNLFFGWEDNSTIQLSNPFASLGEDFYNEYEYYMDSGKGQFGVAGGMKTKKYLQSREQPVWEKGATINYWIKVPAAEQPDDNGRTVGIQSSIMTWTLEDVQFQSDDYAKYLTCHYFDELYEKLDKTVDYNESGVPKDNPYYFEWKRDENGDVIYYKDLSGYYGPCYGTESEIASNCGAWYWFNPNYEQGFSGAPGQYKWKSNEPNYYRMGYNILPVYNKETDSWDLTPENEWGVKTQVRAGKTFGFLQIDSDSSIAWVNDDNRAAEVSNRDTNGVRQGLQNGDCFFMNSWQNSATITSDTKTATAQSATDLANSPYYVKTGADPDDEEYPVFDVEGPDNWHMVTLTLQNDWVEFYLDGKMVDVRYRYSSRGAASIDSTESFKRFNKGSGMRYGLGAEKGMGNIAYGNFVCRLFMDWLTNPDTKFNIGGVVVTNGDSAQYNMQVKTDKVKIAKMAFYSEVMDDAQIAAVYDKGMLATDGVKGDIDGNGTVDTQDALAILKHVVKIAPLDATTEAAADLDGSGAVDTQDALTVLKFVVKLIKEL